MKTRNLRIVLMTTLLALVGGIVTARTPAQTVLGPEYTLTKTAVFSLQRDEKRCDYFLWTKLGGDAQRISFSYLGADGKSEGDAPRIESVTIVINPGKSAPVARMTGMDDNRRTLWQFEMPQEVYNANQRCLTGIPISEKTSK